MHILRSIVVCFVYIITWTLEYCLRKYYLSCLVLLFNLFWMDILFQKNWVVVDHGNVILLGLLSTIVQSPLPLP